MSGYGQPREGGGNMRRLGGGCWWKITSTQGKGKRNMTQVCQVLSCIHLTLLFAALWQIQCWWCTGPGQEGKMKIYCEWENK